MDKIVECVPNFSEGRDKAVLDKIADSIKAIEDVMLFDVDPGQATNRTVFTFVGSPEGVAEAAFQAIKTASEVIDMRQHEGEHARMGATDVCPFVPVQGVTMEDCVEIAKKVGKRVAEELNIPIYLYEEAATSEDRRNLANIRRGEYEGLPKKLKDPKWKPDFGDPVFNAKAGATVIGAREFLIAYNINLNSRNKKLAHDIALNIREKGRIIRDDEGMPLQDEDGNYIRGEDGFDGIKSVGWYIEEFHKAQISMNITNYKVSPLHKIFAYVEKDAIDHGLRVTGSEIVGMLPKEPLLQAGKFFLERQHLNEYYASAGVGERELIRIAIDSLGLNELYKFDITEKVIEYRLEKELEEKTPLRKMTIIEFADELGSDSPAPGGGSVSALAGSMGAALAAMISNISTNKFSFRKADEEELEERQTLLNVAYEAQEIKESLLKLIDKDTQAFDKVMAAMGMPKGTEEEKKARKEAMEKANKEATMVPYETAEKAYSSLDYAKIVAEKGNPASISDIGVGVLMIRSAVEGALMNVRINLSGINDEAFKTEMKEKTESLLEKTKSKAAEILEIVESKL
jgi:glutamate formiminotransferase/formiminotetrahydrofolate cyclodeaminase